MVIYSSWSSSRPTRRLGWGLAGLALVVGVAACGDDSDDGDGAVGCASGGVSGGTQPDEAPAVPTDPAATFEAAIEATRALTSMTGRVDFEFASPEFVGEVGAQVELGEDGVLRVAGSTNGGAETTVCSDGELVWLRVDDESFDQVLDEVKDGARWVEADRPAMADANVLYDAEEAWAVLPILRGVTEVEDAGVEDVGGVPVRVLTGEADFEAARAAASADELAGLDEAISTDAEELVYTVDVGLDADDVVRLLRVTVEGVVAASETDDDTAGMQGEAVTLFMRIEVDAVNPTVGTPTRPSADETVPLDDVPELAPALE